MTRSKVAKRMLTNTPEEIKIYVRLHAALVVKVNRLLNAKGLTQKTAAEKSDKLPSGVYKWLNGEHDFTLRSIAKLEAELGEPLIEVHHRPNPNKHLKTP